MIATPLIRLERIVSACGKDADLLSLARTALQKLPQAERTEIGGVIAATFSNPERFPSLAVRLAAECALPENTPAFDLQMACSAYPYALYLAGHLAAGTGKKILVFDGDVQSRLVDKADHATGDIFSDAVTLTLVSIDPSRTSYWTFLSEANEALSCPAEGPIRMDGMAVFTFVATTVRNCLANFQRDLAAHGLVPDAFVPHQANPYMVRQLAKSLTLTDKLAVLDPAFKNPGSCSIPLTIERTGVAGKILLAGFGAGYSAGAGLVEMMQS